MPQVVTEKEAQIYSELLGQHAEKMRAIDFGGVDKIDRKFEDVGKFVPWFVHDPEEGPIALYPTIVDDCGQLVSICKIVEAYFEEKCRSNMD